MKSRKLFVLALVLGLLVPTAVAAALDNPCVASAAYDPACDVDHDSDVDVTDIQLTANHWNQTGTWISNNSHNHLGQTWEGSNNTLKLTGSYGWPDYAALVLSNSTGDGLDVSLAANTGLFVGSAGFDGVDVYSAGNTGVYVNSAGDDGLRVGTAGGDGLRIGTAGGEGVAVESAAFNGVYVGAAGANGVYVNSASDDGVSVGSADGYGVSVGSANVSGVYVGSANASGVYINWGYSNGVNVRSVGYPSTQYFTPYKNGFQIAGSAGNGLWVGRADVDGVVVMSTGGDGFKVMSAGDNGIEAAGNNYAGYFNGNIVVSGSCVGCRLAMFGVNVSERALTPGDVVAVAGLRETDTDSDPVLAEVIPADTGQPFVGVVSGRAELVMNDDPQPGETGQRLVVRSGAAAPDDYVTIVYSGPVLVKVVPGESAITAGTRLAAAADGAVRPLGTVKVQLADGRGTADLPEGAPVVGMALEAARDGLVWVLVDPG